MSRKVLVFVASCVWSGTKSVSSSAGSVSVYALDFLLRYSAIVDDRNKFPGSLLPPIYSLVFLFPKKRSLSLLVLNFLASEKPTFGRTLSTSVCDHFEKCGKKYAVCQLCKKSSLASTMALGAFSLLHNTIANNNGNDSTNHKKLIISILYEHYCKLESV